MAEIYVGWPQEGAGQGEPVALKRLLPHLLNDRAIVQMFLNEARITQQIQHPNVVKVLDVAMLDAEPLIAMELLQGRSFGDIRTLAAERGQHVPLGITLRVLTEACRGLDAAHRARDEEGRELRIVHRDFTPDNIHVGYGGEVKVIDFGIATAASVARATEPGTLKGKFFYMSPEMITGRPLDHRADLFAAGVMLYEQLCNRRPFTGLTADEVVERIAQGRPRSPRSFDPSVPEALEAICLTALAREPDERFKSLSDFIMAIERVGGVAEVARRDDVARYLERLAPRQGEENPRPFSGELKREPSKPRVKAPKPSLTQAGGGLIARTPRWVGRLGAVLGLLLVLGVAVHTLWRPVPRPPPAILVEQLARESAPDRRRDLVEALLADPRAGVSDLEHAGTRVLGQGDFETALEVAKRLTQAAPRNVEGFLMEGQAEVGLRRAHKAEEAFAKAAERAPSDARVDLARADLYQAEGDLPKAVAVLAQTQARHPSRADIAARRGYLLSQLGELAEAEKVLAGVVQHHEAPEAAAELAFVRFRQGHAAEAAALLRRALAKSPELFAAQYYLGAVLFSLGDPAGAERAYREADKLNTKDARAGLGLCELFSKTGRPDEAKRLGAQLAVRFPDQASRVHGACGAP
jgi:tetratricopeptide (TPR) repeat protein